MHSKYLIVSRLGVSKRKAPTPEFTWLKPYLPATSKQETTSAADADTPIFTIDNSKMLKTDHNEVQLSPRNLSSNISDKLLIPDDISHLSIDSDSISTSSIDGSKFYVSSYFIVNI